MPLRDDTRLRQSDRVACRVYDGRAEVITLDEPIRQHQLNRVGTRIWELTAEGATVEEIVRGITARFDVPPERARDDVRAFCDLLLARGILVEVRK